MVGVAVNVGMGVEVAVLVGMVVCVTNGVGDAAGRTVIVGVVRVRVAVVVG